MAYFYNLGGSLQFFVLITVLIAALCLIAALRTLKSRHPRGHGGTIVSAVVLAAYVAWGIYLYLTDEDASVVVGLSCMVLAGYLIARYARRKEAEINGESILPPVMNEAIEHAERRLSQPRNPPTVR